MALDYGLPDPAAIARWYGVAQDLVGYQNAHRWRGTNFGIDSSYHREAVPNGDEVRDMAESLAMLERRGLIRPGETVVRWTPVEPAP